MQQFPSSEQPKRYQLFPRERQLPVLNSSKAVDSDKASNMAPTGADKPSAAASLKTKISQHSLVRRRKISVPELGPMTTVQEVPMDSRMCLKLKCRCAIVTSSLTLSLPSYDSGAATSP